MWAQVRDLCGGGRAEVPPKCSHLGRQEAHGGAVYSSGILTRPPTLLAGWHLTSRRRIEGGDEFLLPQVFECVHKEG